MNAKHKLDSVPGQFDMSRDLNKNSPRILLFNKRTPRTRSLKQRLLGLINSCNCCYKFAKPIISHGNLICRTGINMQCGFSFLCSLKYVLHIYDLKIYIYAFICCMINQKYVFFLCLSSVHIPIQHTSFSIVFRKENSMVIWPLLVSILFMVHLNVMYHVKGNYQITLMQI